MCGVDAFASVVAPDVPVPRFRPARTVGAGIDNRFMRHLR